MKRLLQKFGDPLFFALLALFVSLLLWVKSDPPPFGTPLNELSDQCWGIYQEIARQWKSGDFSLWTRSIGGGFSLYTSGFFPVWVPWNVIAKFISFDQFYTFKMVEPYFISMLTMAFLLRRGLKLSYPLAAFGSLAYTGAIMTRHVGIIHMPFFLWACAFFPLMVYAYNRLFIKHIYLRAIVLGAFMALIFWGGGAGQFAQMTIWGLILLVIDALFFVKEKSLVRRLLLAAISSILFVAFSFALAGGQILPMAVYTFTESSRTLGEYPINNFPFFRNDYKGNTSIFKIFTISTTLEGNFGVRAFWALMIFSFGKMIVDWKMFCEWWRVHPAMRNITLTTGLFFLVPPVAEMLSNTSAVFAKLFNPLRMFTFGYNSFFIDMVMVTWMVVVLNLKTFSDTDKLVSRQKKQLVLLIFALLAVAYLFLPLWLIEIMPKLREQIFVPHFTERYLVVLCFLVFIFPMAQYRTWITAFLFLCLSFFGLTLVQTCYTWGEKGRQTAKSEYAFDTPEHKFYRLMTGRYYLPYASGEKKRHHLPSMAHNYDLLYGVDGLNGFLNSPPKRLSDFINAYHNHIYWTHNVPAYKFTWWLTPAGLVMHFPVEWTTIRKGIALPWPGFSKKVDGVNYDVWVRNEPPDPVRFARDIQVVSYRELVQMFDRPYEEIIYMTPEDAQKYRPPVLGEKPDLKKATFRDFKRLRSDHWTFEVDSPNDVFVLLPEMYQAGWRLSIDGRAASLFPANSVFMGFFVEKGQHWIELQFRPPLWEAGWLLTFFSMLVFFWITYPVFLQRKKK